MRVFLLFIVVFHAALLPSINNEIVVRESDFSDWSIVEKSAETLHTLASRTEFKETQNLDNILCVKSASGLLKIGKPLYDTGLEQVIAYNFWKGSINEQRDMQQVYYIKHYFLYRLINHIAHTVDYISDRFKLIEDPSQKSYLYNLMRENITKITGDMEKLCDSPDELEIVDLLSLCYYITLLTDIAEGHQDKVSFYSDESLKKEFKDYDGVKSIKQAPYFSYMSYVVTGQYGTVVPIFPCQGLSNGALGFNTFSFAVLYDIYPIGIRHPGLPGYNPHGGSLCTTDDKLKHDAQHASDIALCKLYFSPVLSEKIIDLVARAQKDEKNISHYTDMMDIFFFCIHEMPKMHKGDKWVTRFEGGGFNRSVENFKDMLSAFLKLKSSSSSSKFSHLSTGQKLIIDMFEPIDWIKTFRFKDKAFKDALETHLPMLTFIQGRVNVIDPENVDRGQIDAFIKEHLVPKMVTMYAALQRFIQE